MTASGLPALGERLARWGGINLFAALDGAAFDDLPGLLSRHGFPATSLFIEQTGSSTRRDSPHFAVVEPDRRDAFLRIPGIAAGTVFWRAPPECAPIRFYRHLRGLSLVRLPPAIPDPDLPATTRSGVFRHFDPATVAIALPVMTPAQRARFFGPAIALVIDQPDGALQASRRADWPDAARGPLRFDAAQMAALHELMRVRSGQRIAAYLRDAAPDHSRTLSEASLAAFVVQSEREGRRWGLETEAGLGRFAWLQLVSDGGFARHDRVRSYVISGPGSADHRLRLVMNEMLRVRGAGGGLS